ncbi:MAG: phage integrase central domain-containing protein, partial [Solirubrobacteraceae bacterium]
MAPKPSGQVIVRERRNGRAFGLRFRAYGRREYVTLGTDADGWDRQRAETELENVLADVRRGRWRPSRPEPAPEPTPDPTFHRFASDWYEAHRASWRPKTQVDYRWQLTNHLLPFFADRLLSEINVALVDACRESKQRESQARARAFDAWQRRFDGETEPSQRRELRRSRPPRPFTAATINKTLTRLGQILDVADERELIDRNPMAKIGRGKEPRG